MQCKCNRFFRNRKILSSRKGATTALIVHCIELSHLSKMKPELTSFRRTNSGKRQPHGRQQWFTTLKLIQNPVITKTLPIKIHRYPKRPSVGLARCIDSIESGLRPKFINYGFIVVENTQAEDSTILSVAEDIFSE